ncbi:MAG: hypothetical protein QOE05_3086 [Actinomycetota bacterium]|jgi:uncharacterized membrane-anchored protein YjiN (DUF445 family)|nr:hypothetical protein [Actinomycetota bacterium]
MTVLMGVEDPARVRDLRRMKATAAGFLAVTAAVFVATFAMPDETWVGYLRAAAEAGMVGGLADWFAVTALFRRPLGLPIPHTALIPTRKDQLGAQLGDFVTTNFLTTQNVVERLRLAKLVPTLAAQLATPEVAARISRETTVAVTAALQAVDDDDVTTLLLDLAHRDAGSRSYAPIAGKLLEDITNGGAHRPMLDVVLPYLRTSMIDNREVLKGQLKHFGDRYGFLGWLLATDRRTGKLIDKTIAFMAEIEADPHHELRGVLDDWLRKVAYDLQHDASLARRVDAMVRQVVDDPATAAWLSTVVGGVLTSVRAQLGDPGGPLAERLSAALVRLAQRVTEDVELQQRLETMLERTVVWAVEQHGAEFTALIRHVIDRWDGAQAARQVELFAGRDLQFIRINGTVVGALAGVAIHAVALLLD